MTPGTPTEFGKGNVVRYLHTARVKSGIHGLRKGCSTNGIEHRGRVADMGQCAAPRTFICFDSRGVAGQQGGKAIGSARSTPFSSPIVEWLREKASADSTGDDSGCRWSNRFWDPIVRDNYYIADNVCIRLSTSDTAAQYNHSPAPTSL